MSDDDCEGLDAPEAMMLVVAMRRFIDSLRWSTDETEAELRKAEAEAGR